MKEIGTNKETRNNIFIPLETRGMYKKKRRESKKKERKKKEKERKREMQKFCLISTDVYMCMSTHTFLITLGKTHSRRPAIVL